MWTKKGHLTGQKKPFKLEDIWRIRTRLEIEGNIMELALLNLAMLSAIFNKWWIIVVVGILLI